MIEHTEYKYYCSNECLYIRIRNLSKVDIPKYFNILVSKFMKMKIDCIKTVFVVWLSGS